MENTATLRDTVRCGLDALQPDFFTTTTPGYPTVMGRIVALKKGQPYVDFPGNDEGPRRALTTVEPPAGSALEDLLMADVLLAFAGADRHRPIIVGFPRSSFQQANYAPSSSRALDNSATTPVTPGSQAAPTLSDSGSTLPTSPGTEGNVHVDLDGKRVTLQADQEIRLRCGRSSITMRRDGKIVIQGTHLVSRAEGVNRIKGGSVKVN